MRSPFAPRPLPNILEVEYRRRSRWDRWTDWFCDWVITPIVLWLFLAVLAALAVAWIAGKV